MRYGTEQTEEGAYHLTRTHEDGSFDAATVPELFSPSFMQAHTAYSSFDGLLSDSDMDVRTKQDFR